MKKSLIAAVLLAGMAGPAGAVGNLADISVYDRAENRTLPVYFHEGRYYVAGKPGNEYQVNIRNTQPGVLYALDAYTGKELYNSGKNISTWVHFSGLAIADNGQAGRDPIRRAYGRRCEPRRCAAHRGR